LFLGSQKYDPGYTSWFRILILYPSRILDPGVKKAPDPESPIRIHLYKTCLIIVNLLFLGAKNQLMQKAEGEAGSRLPELPSAAEIKALRNVIRKEQNM
jgi:hypothetical protein